MFHSVNGDRRGNGRLGFGLPALPEDLPLANKGDRGFSDRSEAQVFLIGSPAKERQAL
jgi:hypothetical protein